MQFLFLLLSYSLIFMHLSCGLWSFPERIQFAELLWIVQVCFFSGYLHSEIKCELSAKTQFILDLWHNKPMLLLKIWLLPKFIFISDIYSCWSLLFFWVYREINRTFFYVWCNLMMFYSHKTFTYHIKCECIHIWHAGGIFRVNLPFQALLFNVCVKASMFNDWLDCPVLIK